MGYRPLVQLWCYGGVGVVVLWPSGVWWTNQVGGLCCEHPELEGIYLPLVGRLSEEAAALTDPAQPWANCGRGRCGSPQAITQALGEIFPAGTFRMSLPQHVQSSEAWLYLTIGHIKHNLLRGEVLRPFEGHEAVLTWENSD